MLRQFYAAATGLCLLSALCGALRAQGADSSVLYDASTPVDSIRLQGVEVAKDADGALLIKNGDKDPWPGIHFEGKWDLSAYDAIQFKLRSASKAPISLHVRFDFEKSDPIKLTGIITENVELQPGESKTFSVSMRAPLNPDVRERLFAMRGKPGGIKTDSYSKDDATIYDWSKVVAIRPFETQNKRGDSWVLERVEAISVSDDEKPEYLSWGPDKFFPMIDEFGQFKHKDWPGKTHSLDELRAQVEIEDKELTERQPAEFDEFGGWKNGPKFEATGSFRTQKIDGFWYLVDPIGNLFWSNGIDCVGFGNGVTPLTDREFYFDATIPRVYEANDPLGVFVGKSGHSVNNYYAGRGEYTTYNFTAANLYKKFGPDWYERSCQLAQRRLRSWGLNTIGNWSDGHIAQIAKTPYVATVGTNAPSIEGSSGYWGKFIDPFDPAFPVGIRKALESQKERTAEDPYCIGYFVDNEISWGEKGSLARAALVSPAKQAAKQAYVDWLKTKYEAIEKFNAAWGVQVESWDWLRANPLKTPENDAATADSDAFYTVICEKYFAEIVAAIREVAPKKLYLGCRFAWTNDLARAAAQKYCDVVSYNFYQREVGSFKPVEGEDKPVMIGEFHFGALDRGLFHTGLVPCKDQNDRAKAYEKYVTSALSNPWIVGAHWFQYGDQATTGRFDGENYQIGFVDICDRPYAETIEASRRVGYNMYETRQKEAKR